MVGFLGPLFILILVASVLTAYRSSRGATKVAGRRAPTMRVEPLAPSWQTELSGSLETPVRRHASYSGPVIALLGSVLILVGCALPSSVLIQTAGFVPPPGGKVIYLVCAVIAAFGAAMRRANVMMLAGAILAGLLLYMLFGLGTVTSHDEPRSMGVLFKLVLGPAWIVLMAGSALVILGGFYTKQSES